MTSQPEAEEAKEMLSVYEERGMIKGQRSALLWQMRYKFGELPENVVARVEAIDKEETLQALMERILDAQTIDDMKLPV